MAKEVKLHLDVVNATLDYLSSKPYHEVVGLISKLRASAEALNSSKDEVPPNSKD